MESVATHRCCAAVGNGHFAALIFIKTIAATAHCYWSIGGFISKLAHSVLYALHSENREITIKECGNGEKQQRLVDGTWSRMCDAAHGSERAALG